MSVPNVHLQRNSDLYFYIYQTCSSELGVCKNYEHGIKMILYTMSRGELSSFS